jgi:hypothetical protein
LLNQVASSNSNNRSSSSLNVYNNNSFTRFLPPPLHLFHHRPLQFQRPKQDQPNHKLQLLPQLQARRHHLFESHPSHQRTDLADLDLADAHLIALKVAPNIADKHVLDLLYHGNAPLHKTPRVAEHLHHIVADLQLVAQILPAVTALRILLVLAEHHLAML